MKPSLLIVDDDEEIRTQMKWALVEDYEVSIAGDRAEALSNFKSVRPMVVILDLGLPPRPNSPEEGFATLTSILEIEPTTKIIIVSGQNEKENAVRAVGATVYDFLCKPVQVEELRFLLQRCFYLAGLERDYRELQKSARVDLFEGMIGTSPQMQAVFAFIRKVAPTTAPVLILGESGTGKEMAARGIHQRSPRGDGPFVAINCSAIPENLLESELFGHEKGAFTGAHALRKGLVETASGGTLLLDEIGDIPLPFQVKLLRFLQEKTFQRVGGRQEIQADTRIVAATNSDLKQNIQAGKFREDLYFRLAVVVVNLPALRDRGEDVALLARDFLQRFSSQNGKNGLTFAPDGLRAINRHTWPGNVRELQNRVQRAVIMAETKRITVHDLELAGVVEGAAPATLKESRENAEREVILAALKSHLGKIAPAAAELGISRPTLYELMEKLGIPRA
jgi:two-component system, NtrC family, response regulator